MASGWTNKGKFSIMDEYFRATGAPTVFYLALCNDTVTPDEDTNTLADLAEVPDGQGYTTGGYSLSRNLTDFDVLTEDDATDRAFIQIKDVVWTASGGTLPASGDGARWAVLLDDNASIPAREVICWWDLVSNRKVSDTQTLTLSDCELRLDKPA